MSEMSSFAEFEADALRRGFDAALERVWEPYQVVGTHTHPFAADALIVSGEMWLERTGTVQKLAAGDRFELKPGEPHSERYGPAGAVYWVARRHELDAS